MIDTRIEGSRQEIAILARLLGNGERALPSTMARYIVQLGFSHDDKARMHVLALRNQQGQLSADEKEELIAFAKAGTILGILKSKARRTLGGKVKRRTAT